MEFTVSNSVILTTALCGIVSLVLYHLRRLPLYKAASRYPGPTVLPIIGNALYFMGDPEDVLNKILALGKLYPSPLKFWLGRSLYFGIINAEHFRRIFLSSKTLDKGELYVYAQPWMGTGLFTAPAAKWRAHRKLIAPAFNSEILKTFVEVFSNQSKILVKQMETRADGPEFDIFHYVSRCTLDIICEAAMGVNLNSQADEECRFVEAGKRAFEVMVERMSRVWLQVDFIFKWTQQAKDEREALEYLHGVTNYVIKQKKTERSEANDRMNTAVSDADREPCRKAFLDLLMELSNDGAAGFTDEELREEVDTMIIAGSDTSATIHSFAMLMLASHPKVQDEVYEELCAIYGQDDDGRDVVYEDLHRMDYLERVIKETMRLFPVAPVLVRAVTEDLIIGEHTFPKGSSLMLGVIEVHRSEEYWTNPLTFDPDRFLPEETEKRHPYAYVPFSAGPRNCPGAKYAMLSLKTLLATVFRKYAFKKDIVTPIKDIRLKAHLILQPMDKIMLRIERRRPATDHI